MFFFFFFCSWCIYLFFWCFFFSCGLYMLGGDIMFLFLLLFLVSHVLHWLLIYIMRLFMIYVFYFSILWNQEFILFYLYFPHTHLCVCWVFQEYTGLFSHAAVYWQLIDSSEVELFIRLFCNFEHFSFVICFVTDCQRGSLLGSKTLWSKSIRTSMYNVGEPWSKLKV